jgi:hypothetical protein
LIVVERGANPRHALRLFVRRKRPRSTMDW